MFLIEQIKEVIQRKDLLAYLVSSELQTLYRNKALGFLWAVLDPLFLMLVYVVLVVVIFQRGDPQFPILLFSALIAWRWFISDLSASTRVIVANAKLIQTVKFPVTIFPLSRVLIETFRSLEIRRRPCQNASSSVTLGACPPMTTERLRRPLGFVLMVQLGPIIFSGRTHLAN